MDQRDPLRAPRNGAAGYSPNERRILGFTAVAHTSVHFFEQMFPTAAILIAVEAGVPVATALAWSFLGYMLFGLGALPAGYVADRWESRRMLQVCLIGTGAAGLLVAASSPGVGLVLALGVLGVFSSIYHPAGISLIASGVRGRGRALGVNGVFGNLGIALAPLVTSVTMNEVGWRGVYLVFGGILCVVGLASLGASMEEPSRDDASEPAVGSASFGAGGLFAILCVCMLIAGFTYRGGTLATPAHFAERFSATHFGAAVSAIYLVGTAGQYVAGRLADRYDLRWLYLGFHTMGLPALVSMAFLSGAPLAVAGALFVFFSMGMQPIENSLVASLAPPAWRSTSYGVKFALTFGLGASAAPMVELVRQGTDLSAVFLVLAAGETVLVAFAAWLIVASGRNALRNPPRDLALALSA